MVTEEQVEAARKQITEAKAVIQRHMTERKDAFNLRLKENPIFTDEELRYSATDLCPCGHGIAYPIECDAWHYWDCSAILKGIADKAVEHVGRLPFVTYSVKSERDGHTTRGVFRPRARQT